MMHNNNLLNGKIRFQLVVLLPTVDPPWEKVNQNKLKDFKRPISNCKNNQRVSIKTCNFKIKK